jgi:hypothetical protein
MCYPLMTCIDESKFARLKETTGPLPTAFIATLTLYMTVIYELLLPNSQQHILNHPEQKLLGQSQSTII